MDLRRKKGKRPKLPNRCQYCLTKGNCEDYCGSRITAVSLIDLAAKSHVDRGYKKRHDSLTARWSFWLLKAAAGDKQLQQSLDLYRSSPTQFLIPLSFRNCTMFFGILDFYACFMTASCYKQGSGGVWMLFNRTFLLYSSCPRFHMF